MKAGMDGGVTTQMKQSPAAPSIARRLASMLYESLLAFAIVFFAGLIFLGVVGASAVSEPLSGHFRTLFQIYLVATLGIYFVWCWHRGGQTLPMKTWKLKLTNGGDGPVSVRQATARYLLACLSIAFAGAGLVWAVFDRDRQFLHDRLAGTRIVSSDSGTNATSAPSRNVVG